MLNEAAFPTSWNQIEASMAYGRGLPLFVLVDENVRGDGLLEKGHDWFVQELAIDPASINSPAFIGLLKDWQDRLQRNRVAIAAAEVQTKTADPGRMTVAQLVGALRPAQLWTVLVALTGALAAAFALGVKLAMTD